MNHSPEYLWHNPTPEWKLLDKLIGSVMIMSYNILKSLELDVH